VALTTQTGRLAWIVAAAAITVAVVLAVLVLREKPAPSPPEMRVEINTPSTPAPLEFALSPDARKIVFVATGDGRQRLWLRSLDKDEAAPMPGTEEAEFPFWSPDSRSVAFFASGKLYRTDISGGLPKALADAPAGRGGAWNTDGTILFSPTARSALLRIQATGGQPSALSWLDAVEGSHRFPQFLPDGHHFLFNARGPERVPGIYLSSLDGGVPKRLAAADTAALYLKGDRIMFVRQGALMAQRLDILRGELTGEPTTLADPVGYDDILNVGGFSVSFDGCVAFRARGTERQQLTWFDRTGNKVGVVGDADNKDSLAPEFSRDGRRLAIHRTEENKSAIWVMDLARGNFAPITLNVEDNSYPVWSPDGTKFALYNRAGIYVRLLSGVSPDQQVLQSSQNTIVQDWSKDGRFILYYENTAQTARDIRALDLNAKDAKPLAVATTRFEERVGQFSPDGNWVAYETNESGRFQINVQSFPEPRDKWQVSISGGIQPRWRADGKELYFIAPDLKLMAVPVNGSSSTFESGRPLALFQTQITSSGPGLFRPQYAVSPDGRFLINQPAEGSTSTPITLLLNWNYLTK